MRASTFVASVLVAGCCRESYLAGFEQERADAASRGGFRAAVPFAGGALAVGDEGLVVRFGAAGLTEIDAGVDVDLHALVASPTLIAVGDAGTIVRSVDGEEWTASDPGTGADLHAIAGRGSGGDVVVVGDDTVLLSADGGATWIDLAGDGSPGPLRTVAYVAPGFLAFAASGEAFAVDPDAATFTALGASVGGEVRGVEFDAVGDMWIVRVDGTMWYGFREADGWSFSPGADGPCGDATFRPLGDYTLCDDGSVREVNAFLDDPGLPIDPFVPVRAAAASGGDLLLFGEDGVARLYAPRYRKRRGECGGHGF